MILCLGTTPTVQRTMMFDRLVPDAVNRASRVYENASGKSVNVARVARTLGAAVAAVGFAGGVRGDYLRRGLEGADVRHDFVNVPGQTRLCTTVIDLAGGHVTELVEESAPVDAPYWDELLRKFVALLPGAKVAVLSGSLAPGGPADFYARCAAPALAAGSEVLIDARGQPLAHVLKFDRVSVKLNREELAATVGRNFATDDDLRRAMRETAPRGGRVVVTEGKHGAFAFDAGGYWRIPTPQVDALNPIGSGDSFAAGLAVGMLRGAPPAEAYALASACGAANALTEVSGVVRMEDVARLLGHVKVEAW